jgi:hypothetical protein
VKSFNLAEAFDRVIVLELAMHEHVEADSWKGTHSALSSLKKGRIVRLERITLLEAKASVTHIGRLRKVSFCDSQGHQSNSECDDHIVLKIASKIRDGAHPNNE